MIVSIHQPHYMPWTGYFDKADSSDVFVLLDTVQFEKNGWQNRNRIKTANGWMWLTVPVSHNFGTSIGETLVNNTVHWTKKHRQALVTNYSKAPFFSRYFDFFDELYSQDWVNLSELNERMFRYFAQLLGLGSKIVTASELGDFSEDPNERLAEIVGTLGGDVYLAGSGCTSYLREEVFTQRGIRVLFQDYKPVEYPQLYQGFEPGLAIIDPLFNIGPDTLDTIRKGRRTQL